MPTPRAPPSSFPPKAGSLWGGSTLDLVAHLRVRNPLSLCAAAGGMDAGSQAHLQADGEGPLLRRGPGASVCSTLTSSEGRRAARRHPSQDAGPAAPGRAAVPRLAGTSHSFHLSGARLRPRTPRFLNPGSRPPLPALSWALPALGLRDTPGWWARGLGHAGSQGAPGPGSLSPPPAAAAKGCAEPPSEGRWRPLRARGWPSPPPPARCAPPGQVQPRAMEAGGAWGPLGSFSQPAAPPPPGLSACGSPPASHPRSQRPALAQHSVRVRMGLFRLETASSPAPPAVHLETPPDAARWFAPSCRLCGGIYPGILCPRLL